jgi:hypothetical protein
MEPQNKEMMILFLIFLLISSSASPKFFFNSTLVQFFSKSSWLAKDIKVFLFLMKKTFLISNFALQWHVLSVTLFFFFCTFIGFVEFGQKVLMYGPVDYKSITHDKKISFQQH